MVRNDVREVVGLDFVDLVGYCRGFGFDLGSYGSFWKVLSRGGI